MSSEQCAEAGRETAVDTAVAELRAQIGTVHRTSIGPVTDGVARRFAAASGERDSIYTDAAMASAQGHPRLPVAPMLLPSVRTWVPQAGPDLRRDGTPIASPGFPTSVEMRAVGGGQSLTFHRDVDIETPIVVEVEVMSVTTKEGRNGTIVIVGLERRFLDEDGRPLVTCDESRVLR